MLRAGRKFVEKYSGVLRGEADLLENYNGVLGAKTGDSRIILGR